ncbi:MAG: Uncharacterised protein [Cryomorphaceae bacterium]|nr:MAG: Uncharacterised protein [Cryomorphaceae bacterium]
MSPMKKISTLLAVALSVSASAQISTIPDENIDPSDSLEIIFDPAAMDLTVGHQDLLKQAVDNGEDLYIWTWKPAEHPDGHPFVNGTGSAPWKNSNEAMKMTKNADGTFSWKIVPTLFYEVDATTVYNEDIHFVIKAKDGGGYGDPDVKTDDQTIAIDPPATERNAFYHFPAKVMADDIVTLRYENWREEKESMQNLDPEDCYMYAKVYFTDGSFVQIENTFNVGSNPKLKMDYVGDGNFEKLIVPGQFFNIPAGKTIDYCEFIAMKKVFATGADRVTLPVNVQIECQ